MDKVKLNFVQKKLVGKVDKEALKTQFMERIVGEWKAHLKPGFDTSVELEKAWKRVMRSPFYITFKMAGVTKEFIKEGLERVKEEIKNG